MTKLKIALLKGRREIEGSSGVDFFILNLYEELKTHTDIEVNLIYGNYKLPGMFKYLIFKKLDEYDLIHNAAPALGFFVKTKKPIITTFYDDIMFKPETFTQGLKGLQKYRAYIVKKLWSSALIEDIKKSKKVIAISPYAKNALINRLKISAKQITVIPPGIRTDIFKPFPKNLKDHTTTKLLYYGRISYRKGSDILLDAMQLLRNEIPDIRLELIGIIAKEFFLIEEIKKRNLEGVVNCRGFLPIEEIVKSLQSSDVFVFPSRAEGYGIPPIEALACGVKVVSTPVPSVGPFDEIIKVAVNPRSLANGIRKALKVNPNPQVIRQRMDYTYSLSAVAGAYVREYKKIIDEK